MQGAEKIYSGLYIYDTVTRRSRIAGRADGGGRRSLLGLFLLHREDAGLDGVLEDELRNLDMKATHTHTPTTHTVSKRS